MFHRIALHARPGIQSSALRLILETLKQQSKEIFLTLETEQEENGYPLVDFSKTYDLFIIVGGDGSILSVVGRMEHFQTPLLPISAGTVGFLADIAPHSFPTAFARIKNGEYTEDRRALLQVTLQKENGEQIVSHGLNDAVVSQSSVARIVSIRTLVNDRYLTTYRADGIIVATPTGSTAYSLSAGGPIVSPEFSGLILTPVSPHTLSHRSLILPQEKEVTLFADAESREDVLLTIDGQRVFSMEKQDRVLLRIHSEKATFLRLPEEHFFKTLKRKMHWGGGEI